MGVGNRISGRKGCSKMIQINQLKLDIHHKECDLKKKILKTLRISEEQLISYTIRKQSIDARKKPVLFYVYTVDVEVTPKNFGRIAAQKAKQVVVQKIREEERKVLYDQYYTKEKDIITGTVQRYSNGNYTVNIGKIDTVLTEQEQVKTERFRSHEKIRVYVTEVKDTPRGPRIVISRTHPELVKRLFEAEVAEIQSGVVEIKSVSREAGSRSKIAVYSRNPDVDAVGACVGMNGARVNAVVNELRGEKIDIVEWNENPAIFIEHALSPSRVVSVTVDIEEKSALVVVPDYQLSLAIGKEGQNARLAAKLTGYKIDIKSETQNQEG